MWCLQRIKCWCMFINWKKSKLFYLHYVRKENYVFIHGSNRLLFNFKLSLTTQELIYKRLFFNIINKPTRLTSSDTIIHPSGVIIYLRWFQVTQYTVELLIIVPWLHLFLLYINLKLFWCRICGYSMFPQRWILAFDFNYPNIILK